ncbi:hypothetical protein LIA77_01515 [Sarocladium implicatum]|nr:hypothetical protein LIA77_01515 [Sarocladium implicatum]
MGGSLMYFGRSRRGHHPIDARYWLAVIDDMLLFLPTFDLARSTTTSSGGRYLTSPDGTLCPRPWHELLRRRGPARPGSCATRCTGVLCA